VVEEGTPETQFSIARIRKNLTKSAEGTIDISELWHKLVKEITLIDPQEDTKPENTFGHLFGGYECQYYQYLWS